MPLSKKVRLADMVIDGTAPRQDAMKAIRGIFLDLLKQTWPAKLSLCPSRLN
jgi:hypothetical protein